MMAVETKKTKLVCPFCESDMGLVKAGRQFQADGPHQIYECRNPACRRHTTKPKIVEEK